MNKLKDFIHYISDIIMALVVVFIILFVFYKNISVFFSDIFDQKLSVNIKEIVSDDISNTSINVNTDSEKTENLEEQNNINAETSQNSKSDDESVTFQNKETNTSQTEKSIEQTSIPQNINTEDKSGDTQNLQVNPNNENKENSKNEITKTVQSNNNFTVTIVIPANSTSTQIVDILYDNKLITSKDEITIYLKENHLETKLKSGTFTINSTMSVEEIVDTISL
ncbi:hypothetical protein HMPREF9629_02162 [Peptoanaerobacter stomatis]|uniref:YceG-like domain protein n=1 Tax=Peptoanaerobacter stomatis TaxID=796937 RepID=G9X1B8_9FIRM|nr:endolytic transglycosylase MltG [Peptoanaerobacter stomatis]EHL14505.1 hypothetical protein HMPREF9629_02162 [Peptoanaerobacter stomatis]